MRQESWPHLSKQIFGILALAIPFLILPSCKRQPPALPNPAPTSTQAIPPLSSHTMTALPSFTASPTTTPTQTWAPSSTATATPTATCPGVPPGIVPHAQGAVVYWTHLYSFDNGVTLIAGNKQSKGPGYPMAFSAGPINPKNMGGNPTWTSCDEDPGGEYFAEVDEGACPVTMPTTKPQFDWAALQALAAASGCDWSALSPVPSFYTGVEQGFWIKPGDSDYPGPVSIGPPAQFSVGNPLYQRISVFLASAPAGCGGSLALDNQTFLLDTTDGAMPGPANLAQEVDANGAYFRGQAIFGSDLNLSAGGGISTFMAAPGCTWLPASATEDVNFHGLLGVGGDIYWAGNPIIYGSVVVGGAVSSLGTMTIYANQSFPYSGMIGGGY